MIMEHLNIPYSDWVRYEESYESIIWSNDSKCTKDEWENAKSELQAAEPMRLLRIERNKLLASTDWWVLPDRTATQAQLDYRQALRDITTQTPSLDENGNLTGITWPTPPTD